MRSRVPSYIVTGLLCIALWLGLSYGWDYAKAIHYRAQAGAVVYVWLNSKPTPDSKPRIELLEDLLKQAEKK